ncbi:MAG: glycosyltransferase [Pseudomonadota bacterium]
MADKKLFATSVPYFSEPLFSSNARYLWGAVNEGQMGSKMFELRNALSIFWASLTENVVVVDSTPRSGLIGLCLAALVPARFRAKILFHGEMYAPDTGFAYRVQRAMMQFADRAIDKYLLIAGEEVTAFPEIWGVPAGKMEYIPFFWTIKVDEIDAELKRGDYVFAGGDSFRDYNALVEAAEEMPEIRFVIATRRHLQDTTLPPNVTAGPVPREEFMSTLCGAGAVVVPVDRDVRRAVGQQTYLNAMRLGKPTVVTDTVGVRDYIVDGETGFIVDGSKEDFLRTLRRILDPAEASAVEAIAAQGQAYAADLSFERHAREIVASVQRVAGQAPRGPRIGGAAANGNP